MFSYEELASKSRRQIQRIAVRTGAIPATAAKRPTPMLIDLILDNQDESLPTEEDTEESESEDELEVGEPFNEEVLFDE